MQLEILLLPDEQLIPISEHRTDIQTPYVRVMCPPPNVLDALRLIRQNKSLFAPTTLGERKPFLTHYDLQQQIKEAKRVS